MISIVFGLTPQNLQLLVSSGHLLTYQERCVCWASPSLRGGTRTLTLRQLPLLAEVSNALTRTRATPEDLSNRPADSANILSKVRKYYRPPCGPCKDCPSLNHSCWARGRWQALGIGHGLDFRKVSDTNFRMLNFNFCSPLNNSRRCRHLLSILLKASSVLAEAVEVLLLLV